MAKSSELDEFSQALVAALRAMRRANEIPSYLSGKAREINASYIEGLLKEVLATDALKAFLKTNGKMKICSDDNIRTKEDIIREINDVKPFIDRLKSGGFKLMIDRYLAAHELAVRLSDIVDEISSELRSQQLAAERDNKIKR